MSLRDQSETKPSGFARATVVLWCQSWLGGWGPNWASAVLESTVAKSATTRAKTMYLCIRGPSLCMVARGAGACLV